GTNRIERIELHRLFRHYWRAKSWADDSFIAVDRPCWAPRITIGFHDRYGYLGGSARAGVFGYPKRNRDVDLHSGLCLGLRPMYLASLLGYSSRSRPTCLSRRMSVWRLSYGRVSELCGIGGVPPLHRVDRHRSGVSPPRCRGWLLVAIWLPAGARGK